TPTRSAAATKLPFSATCRNTRRLTKVSIRFRSRGPRDGALRPRPRVHRGHCFLAGNGMSITGYWINQGEINILASGGLRGNAGNRRIPMQPPQPQHPRVAPPSGDAARQPAIFLPHGGGPCFFMDWPADGNPWER